MEVKNLLKLLIAKEASDLHLVVGLPPMIRINGVLEKAEDRVLASDDIAAMVAEVLPPEVKLPKDEDLDLGIDLGSIARFRLNVYRDRNGLCASFRLIPNLIRSLEELGLPNVVAQVAKMRRGLVLITGITGSGKSTTLASLIDMINSTRRDHIITIEDPIEFIHPHKKCVINQRQVGVHTASFADALRAALREDPDVILVGELRDLETIAIAMTAAETGHLVLSTLHTRGAAQSIDRIIDIFPAQQQDQIRIQLAETLSMVVSQVLLPSVDGTRRYLATEVMVTTPAIRTHIRNKKTFQIPVEIETGIDLGMQPLEKSLKSLIDAGKIARDSALPWVGDKRYFLLDY